MVLITTLCIYSWPDFQAGLVGYEFLYLTTFYTLQDDDWLLNFFWSPAQLHIESTWKYDLFYFYKLTTKNYAFLLNPTLQVFEDDWQFVTHAQLFIIWCTCKLNRMLDYIRIFQEDFAWKTVTLCLMQAREVHRP